MKSDSQDIDINGPWRKRLTGAPGVPRISRRLFLALLPSDSSCVRQDIVLTPMPSLQRSSDTNRLPHLLLYGPPGTGKTSTVLALARRIYGNKNMRQMVLELNASDDRGIDVVREQIKNFAETRTLFTSVPFPSPLTQLTTRCAARASS